MGGIEYTSVPRWHEEAPQIDASARFLTVISVGTNPCPLPEPWRHALASADRPVHVLSGSRADEELLTLVRRDVETAVVGWRLLLIGPEADVLRLRAEALHCGAVPSEVLAHVTSAQQRTILCVHCDTLTSAQVEIDATVSCSGCARTLQVYHHVSRRLAAYMGFKANAEDTAPERHAESAPA